MGGAEAQMITLIRGLIHKNYHCELFTLESDGPLRSLLEPLQIVIHDGGYNSNSPKWKRLLQLIRAEFRLWNLARRTRPDVLHAYLPLTNFMGAIAGTLAGVHTVITSRRALGTHQDRHRLWKPFDRMANRLSDLIIVNSLAVRNDTMYRDNTDPDKLIHIPNGLDTEDFKVTTTNRRKLRQELGLNTKDIGLITVGNLIPYKGHADLLNAMPSIIKSYPNIRCYIAGEDRGIRKELVKLTHQIEISEYVIFLGQRNDIPELLMAMDIFVFPSHEEGFSNALLEAMASGLAIIATDVGGNKEALDNGRLGLLTPSKNPAALASTVIKLLSNNEQLRQLGQLGKTYVNNKYPISNMVDAHSSLYKSSLSNARH
ncbi:MAG: glycosyltransferase [Thiotrichaceae bacterium]